MNYLQLNLLALGVGAKLAPFALVNDSHLSPTPCIYSNL